MKKKLIGIGAVVLVLALLLTLAPACGNGDEEATPTPGPGKTPTPGVTPTPTGEVKTLKIGFYGPLSGPAVAWGGTHEQGTIWAADDINDAGGMKIGGVTYMIEIVSCDTKFLGSVAATCASELAYEHGVHYVIGPISTAAYEAAREIFHDNKIFNITISATFLGGPEWPYYINGSTDYQAWQRAFYVSLTEHHPEIKRFAIVGSDTESTRVSVEAAIKTVTDLGLTVVAEEYYTMGVIDFYPVLTKILANNPDIIDTEGQPGDQALMVKQLRELGYTGRIAEPSYVPLGILIGTAGKDYVYGISTGLPDFECEYYSDEMRDLARRYMAEQARPDETDMPDCVVHGYSQIMFLKKAFEQADSLDTDEVMKVFDDPDFRFERYYTPNAKLGGFETWGIRRQMPHFNPYCEIMLVDGEPTLVQLGGTVVEMP